MEIVTQDPNNERTYRECIPAWKRSSWNSTHVGNITPSVPRGTEVSNIKKIFHQLCWMKYPLTAESPKESKCFSVLEAASHAAVSRGPHTGVTFLSTLISFHSDKWITEINLKSDSENFSGGLFFFKGKDKKLKISQ